MKPKFQVRVVSFDILEQIAGVWTAESYTRLLHEMDFMETEGLSEADLREMCLLALQDLKPEAAAALLLKDRLSDALSAGQINNCANEMLEEKLWEEYSDQSLHERLFHVGSLLFAAFPRVFPRPDASRVQLEVSAANHLAEEILAAPHRESFLVRLVMDGMDANAGLHRLFGDQLTGDTFPEADTIVWIATAERQDAQVTNFVLTSSGYWLDALRETKSFESSAYPDPSPPQDSI